MIENESALNFTNCEFYKEEVIPHEESFLSKLNLVKPDSVIISNPNLSFCEENGGTKKEFNNLNSLNFCKNLPNFNFDSSEDSEDINSNNRKTIGPCKKVKFLLDTDSVDIFGNDLINKKKNNQEITRKLKDVNATPQFKKTETRSNSSRSQSKSQSKSKLKNNNISRSIDDKHKKFSTITKDKINSIKINLDTRDKSSDSLIKSKTQSELRNYFSTGHNFKYNNIKNLTRHNLKSFNSKAKFHNNKYKEENVINSNKKDINENFFKENVTPIRNIISNQTKNNSPDIIKVKEFFEAESFGKKFEILKTKISETQDKREKLNQEKSSEIINFMKNICDEKLEKILEIHQKYDNDLNKLEDMLDPADVHNISHKIYHCVLEDKLQELREVEVEYNEKKSKGIELIEKNYVRKSSLFYVINDNCFNEFLKQFSQDMIEQITKIFKKKEKSKNPRKNYSLTNINSIDNPSNGLETRENKNRKSKRNKPAFRI